MAKGPGFCFAQWGQVYILDWRSTLTIPGLDASVTCKRIALQRFPQGLVLLNLVNAQAPVPSQEMRRYAERKQNEDTKGVLCHATVMLGDGFRASAARSMLAGLYLVARSPFPRKAFSEVREAAVWLASHSYDTSGPTARKPGPGPGWVEQLLLAAKTVQSEPET